MALGPFFCGHAVIDGVRRAGPRPAPIGPTLEKVSPSEGRSRNLIHSPGEAGCHAGPQPATGQRRSLSKPSLASCASRLFGKDLRACPAQPQPFCAPPARRFQAWGGGGNGCRSLSRPGTAASSARV
jgi:hypothetical protein